MTTLVDGGALPGHGHRLLQGRLVEVCRRMTPMRGRPNGQRLGTPSAIPTIAARWDIAHYLATGDLGARTQAQPAREVRVAGEPRIAAPVSLITASVVVTSMPSMHVRSTPYILKSCVRRSNFGCC